MIALVVNPFAGRGRAGTRAHAVARALATLDSVRIYETRAAGDERRCARAACSDGARLVAVVGGDGSVHHTVRGLLDDAPTGERTRIPLAIFAAGTGNDFVKSFGSPSHDVARMTARIAQNVTRVVDVGYIDDVPFVNAAGLGFDVEVLERMERVRWITGTAAYVVTALRALFGYGGYRADIRADIRTEVRAGQPTSKVPEKSANDARRLLTVFANGATFGGTFRIAPTAKLDDGMLDFVNIGSLAPLARPAVFLAATRGAHLDHASVTSARGASFTITSETPLTFEADGERYVARACAMNVVVERARLTMIA